MFALCYSSRKHTAKPNTFYGIDPYLHTCEELAQSPTYFKQPVLTALNNVIYCFETYEEDYMTGKLVVSVFDAISLYD